MDKIALDLGFVQIYWYSIFILLGVVFASIVILSETRKQKINEDFMVNLIFYGVIFGLIGARLYYVAFNYNYYISHPIEIFEVWNGGLAIHGGILFGLITVYLYTKKYNAKFLKVLDIIVVGLILGQAIGRWGNFFNGEVYGKVTTIENLKHIGLPDFIINGMNIEGAYRLPLFLYESIWSLTGFFALIMIRKFYVYLKSGQLTGIYLIWYSFGRFIMEGLRDEKYALMLGNFRIAQIISILLIIIGIVMIVFCKKGARFDNLYKSKESKEINF